MQTAQGKKKRGIRRGRGGKIGSSAKFSVGWPKEKGEKSEGGKRGEFNRGPLTPLSFRRQRGGKRGGKGWGESRIWNVLPYRHMGSKGGEGKKEGRTFFPRKKKKKAEIGKKKRAAPPPFPLFCGIKNQK